ncbi:MAG: phosphatidate cytidylyltransferase [Bacteroidales bacterium]|nr:phosphatidate cytidylyltransferase [Bacteroidales bacterium]
MLRTRLVVGSLLAAGAGTVLGVDPGPLYPGLLVLVLLLGLFSAWELRQLLHADTRPHFTIVGVGVLLLIAVNWLPQQSWVRLEHDSALVGVLAGAMLAAMVWELLTYRGTVHGTPRLANTLFILLYIGVLPTFLLRMRWFPESVALAAMTATIFVPKCGDIGAYFTGRFLGRHPFAPTLSPKKTWEGFCGGLLTSIATAIGLGIAAPLFPHGLLEAVGFGIVVGIAGVLGDLAESMIKRDAQVKDAATSIPGFGGLLDVMDSVLFAAPISYLWLTSFSGWAAHT